MTRATARNALALAAVRVAAPVLSLIVVAAVSRRLGAEGLGRYSAAYAFLGLFGLLSAAGLPQVLTREAARRPEETGRLLGGALGLAGGCGAFLAVLMTAAATGVEDPATRQAVRILSLALPPAAWSACLEAAWLARERTGPIGAACLAEHAAKVALGGALLAAGSGLNAVLAAAVAGKWLSCAVSGVWLRRTGVRLDWSAMRELALPAAVLALSAVSATLYWRVDVLLLSCLCGAAETGYYTAAYRLLDAAILLPQSLCQALFPRLAAGNAGQPPERWLLGLTLPAAALAAAGAGPILEVLYGPALRPAAPVLALLIWTAVPYAGNRYRACRLVAADRQRTDLSINLALLGVNVGANILLIPKWGAAGAAFVTLATAVLYGAAQSVCLRKAEGSTV